MNARKYQIDTDENRRFLEEARDALLAFGRRFPSPGGSSWYLGDDGTPWKDKNRETYVTCRMAHVYSLGKLLGFKGSENLVDAALRALTGELRDAANGGWYSGLTAENAPLSGKLCYVHAFVILAAASAALIGRPGAEALLDEALEVYDRYFWDEAEGLSRDTWDTDFTKADDYRGLNANMHSVEAFLAVADVTGREEYRRRAGRIIERVLGWASPNSWRLPEHFTRDWVPDLECNRERLDDPFKPYGATPGHGIEWSRLIVQWALSTYPNDAEKVAEYTACAERLFNRAVEDGWNSDGAPGIVYTTDWEGHPIVHERMHWTLAEAIDACAVLYRQTGKAIYAERYAEFMEYLDACVLDHEHGSWFHQLDRHNHVSGSVWPGKPDIYHALQATLIPYCGADASIAVLLRRAAAQ